MSADPGVGAGDEGLDLQVLLLGRGSRGAGGGASRPGRVPRARRRGRTGVEVEPAQLAVGGDVVAKLPAQLRVARGRSPGRSGAVRAWRPTGSLRIRVISLPARRRRRRSGRRPRRPRVSSATIVSLGRRASRGPGPARGGHLRPGRLRAVPAEERARGELAGERLERGKESGPGRAEDRRGRLLQAGRERTRESPSGRAGPGRGRQRQAGLFLEPERRAELGHALAQARAELGRASAILPNPAFTSPSRDDSRAGSSGAVMPSGWVAERTSLSRRCRESSRLTSSIKASPSDVRRSFVDSSTTVSGDVSPVPELRRDEPEALDRRRSSGGISVSMSWTNVVRVPRTASGTITTSVAHPARRARQDLAGRPSQNPVEARVMPVERPGPVSGEQDQQARASASGVAPASAPGRAPRSGRCSRTA